MSVIRSSIVTLILACVIGTLSFPASARARVFHFEISRQALPAALQTYADISGQEVIFTEAVVAGSGTASLVGDYTAEDALQRLLAGTTLIAERSPSGALMIRRRPQAANHSASANYLPLQPAALQHRCCEAEIDLRLTRSDRGGRRAGLDRLPGRSILLRPPWAPAHPGCCSTGEATWCRPTPERRHPHPGLRAELPRAGRTSARAAYHPGLFQRGGLPRALLLRPDSDAAVQHVLDSTFHRTIRTSPEIRHCRRCLPRAPTRARVRWRWRTGRRPWGRVSRASTTTTTSSPPD